MANPGHDSHDNSPADSTGNSPRDSDEAPPAAHLRVDLAFPTRDLPLPGNADDY